MSTTENGVPIEDLLSGDDYDADAAFSKLWGEDAAKPSEAEAEKEEDEDNNEGSEDELETKDEDGDEKSTDDDEGDEDGEEKDGDDDNDANVVVKDDYKVKVTVDGVEKDFTVGQLKRLAGQEASLTQKSQKFSEDRKTLDGQAAAHLAAYDRLLDQAKKRFAPYEKLNFFALSKDPDISQEELVALQTAAQDAYTNVQFLTQEMGAFQQELSKQRTADIRAQAAETVKVLSDPEKGIPGWNEKTYGEMMSFASEVGVPAEALNEIVDPISLRIIHMAMLYKRGQKTVKEQSDQKATSKKKAAQKAPKKIVKINGNSETNKEALKGSPSEREARAMKRLRSSGSSEDAENAFAARFERGSDED